MGPYDDRQQAGVELALALDRYRDQDCVILAIPRGGVVVGYEVAQALDCDLDVIVPRKIGAPNQPELAIGAVATWGDHQIIIDEHAVRALGVSSDYLEQEAQQQSVEANRRLLAYRGTLDPPEVEGRTVLLVDDGIATGYTTRAAAIAVRHLDPSEVVLAVPVGPPESVRTLRPYVDGLVCLRTPEPFLAVGYWYRDFAQVSDEEVVELLRLARESRAARRPG